jgi:hypothetical protein
VCSPGENYVTTGHTFGYSHSFRPEHIARYLFGDSTLNFAGSKVIDRAGCELLSDYFGLSPYFRGCLRVHPTIENYYLDNQIFIGLDRWVCGLYIQAHAPLAYTRWNLRLCQINSDQTDSIECPPYPPCYMSTNSAPATCDIIETLSGNVTFGAMEERWHFGKFSPRALSKTRLADIDLILGYDIWRSPDYHLGFYVQTVMPTGNKPNGRHIFEPIVGNGHHWELGGGISGHLVLWERSDDQALALYLEANVTHLFKNTQCRSFDFCNNGPLSRYILLREFEINGTTIEPTGRLTNGINFATRRIRSSVGVKGDASVKLAYRSDWFALDIGYNFYGNTREHVKLCQSQPDCNTNKRFGIKGIEGICALEYSTTGMLPLELGPLVGKIPLNSTESNATIRSGAPTDNPQAPPLLSPSNRAVSALSKQSGIISDHTILQAQLSEPPILLSIDDLNIRSGQAGATATHKLFGYIGYNVDSPCRGYTLYGGIGGEIEVEGLACNERTSLNQWGIWLKGGIAF